MIEIIQHFFKIKKIYYIYIYTHKYFWDTGCHRFHSVHFFDHTPIHLHALTRYSDAHPSCEKSLTWTASKVSSKIIPIDSSAVYSSCTMFLFVSALLNVSDPFPLFFSTQNEITLLLCARETVTETVLYAGQHLFIVSCSNHGNRIRF